MSIARQREGGSAIGLLRYLFATVLISGAVLSCRIAFYGEAWNERTFTLVLMAMAGGASGALALLPIRNRLNRKRKRVLIGGPIFGVFFMLAMGAGFIIHMAFVAETIEINPDFYWRSLIFGSVHEFALFLISAPTYLMFWPLPLITLVAVFMLPVEREAKAV